MPKTYFDDFGVKLVNVHAEGDCWREVCVIHKPTWHHMRGMKKKWRNDRGFFERVCDHGVGHPDPDEILDDQRMLGVHGCDGCCAKNV